MTRTSSWLLLWGPRLAGFAVAVFLGLFALDAFNGQPILAALRAFAIHLIPSALVLIVVAIAWRFEWIGALGFIALAVLYAISVHGRADWIAVISGPLLLVGLLFLLSWWHRANLHAVK